MWLALPTRPLLRRPSGEPPSVEPESRCSAFGVSPTVAAAPFPSAGLLGEPPLQLSLPPGEVAALEWPRRGVQAPIGGELPSSLSRRALDGGEGDVASCGSTSGGASMAATRLWQLRGAAPLWLRED